jgi:hypothetical protein
VHSSLLTQSYEAYEITLLSVCLCSLNCLRFLRGPPGKKANLSPVASRGGLQGCVMLRIPYCLDNRLTGGGKAVSPKQRYSTP